MKPAISKTCIFNAAWMSVILWGLIIWGVGCMRTDNHRETYYPTGELKSYHSISNTSWCVDSNFKEASIDPDGTVTVKNYDKKADSLKGNYNPVTGVTIESKGESK
jgi:hypothetical protein